MRSRIPLAAGAALLLAAVRLSAQAAAPSSGDPDFNPVCHFDAALCGKFKALKDKLDEIVPEASPPFPAKPGRTVSESQLAAFNAEFRVISDETDHALKRHPQAGEKLARAAAERLRRRLNDLTLKTVEDDIKNNPIWIASKEDQLTALEREVRRAGPRPSRKARARLLSRLDAIDLECAALWDFQRQISENIDYAGPQWPGVGGGFAKTKAAEHAEKANALHERSASLRDRLQALACRLGRATPSCPPSALSLGAAVKRLKERGLLSDPFAAKGGAASASDSPRLAPAGRPPRRSLLDMPRPPAPAREGGPRAGAGAILLPASTQDTHPDETLRIARFCMAGQCRRIGSPDLHEGLVYRQSGGTCAIAAQVMILRWLGLRRETPSEKLEDELYAEAVRKGYFTLKASDPERREKGGTPFEFLGNLLPARPRKRYLASDGQLYGAVSRGKLILVSLDSGLLWNDTEQRGKSHAVVIIGALVHRRTNELLGYYINDTGRNEGGRFVNAKQFREAWHANGRAFVEPL